MKLTTEQFDALALELDALKLQIKQHVGEADARVAIRRHYRNVTAQLGRLDVIVARPVFEQVSEDIERACVSRRAARSPWKPIPAPPSTGASSSTAPRA